MSNKTFKKLVTKNTPPFKHAACNVSDSALVDVHTAAPIHAMNGDNGEPSALMQSKKVVNSLPERADTRLGTIHLR